MWRPPLPPASCVAPGCLKQRQRSGHAGLAACGGAAARSAQPGDPRARNARRCGRVPPRRIGRYDAAARPRAARHERQYAADPATTRAPQGSTPARAEEATVRAARERGGRPHPDAVGGGPIDQRPTHAHHPGADAMRIGTPRNRRAPRRRRAAHRHCSPARAVGGAIRSRSGPPPPSGRGCDARRHAPACCRGCRRRAARSRRTTPTAHPPPHLAPPIPSI